MEPFTRLTGIVAPLEALNVDTDQIIPKQFLKRTERTGYEKFLFYDWRYLDNEMTPNPDFELNAPRYQGATILLTKENFGCGSSREHAPWALHDYGFRCILAPSYAEIFYNNCFNNGMLPITLPSDTIDTLFDEVRAQEGYQLTVDLNEQTITKPDGSILYFEIDPYKRYQLIEGLDTIGLTLRHVDKIAEYEKQRGMA